MLNLKSDMEVASDIINNVKVITKSNFGSTCINTNEYVAEYIKDFKTNDGKILSVLGSGDQILYSILNGAKDIDSFDINQCSYYFFMLKIGAIKALNRNDYINFFPVTKEEKDCYFDKKTYEIVRKKLNNEIRLYWDYLYKNGFDVKYKKLINDSEILNERDNVYYDKNKYDVLKEKLNICKIRFYHNDLFKLPYEIINNNNYYDCIFLSNLFDNSKMSAKEYLNFLNEKIKPILNEDGICLAWYLFKADSDILKKDLICKHIYSEGRKVAGVRLIRKNN